MSEATHDGFRGTVLADEAWLAARVADTHRRWGCETPRVAGTLWWYSASHRLTADAPGALLRRRRAPDPALRALVCTLTDYGYLGEVRSTAGGTLAADAYGEALADAFGAVIGPLARVSGAAERALWAVASDSLANNALAAGRSVGDADGACALAERIAAPPLLPPRFHDVDGRADDRRVVRRSSCCLIYCTRSGGDKCASCPRRHPDERAAAIRAALHAAGR